LINTQGRETIVEADTEEDEESKRVGLRLSSLPCGHVYHVTVLFSLD
jgi:hypothetical protein